MSAEQKVLVDAMLFVVGTAQKYNSVVFELQGEINRLKLTPEEREAIEMFAAIEWTSIRWSEVERHAATLRTLLERMT